MTRANIVRNIINDDGYYYTKHSILEIVNVIFDDHEAQLKALYFQITELKMMEEDAQQYALRCSKELKAKDEEIERLFDLIKSLWQIIDDIDTYGDMAKSDDALFRRLVENKQKERWKLPISADGYEIFLKDNA